ncbi:hypothetical protein [Lunatimonas lonarensis]|nr:hypothetical protein [Lunatimonas lonarensis]
MTKLGSDYSISRELSKNFAAGAVVIVISIMMALVFEWKDNVKKREINFIKAALEEPISLGKSIIHDVEFTLKMKLENENLQYILIGKFLSDPSTFDEITIELFDKDGFNIAEIYVYDWSMIIDRTNKPIGIEKNGYFEWDDYESYQQIKSFRMKVSY